MIFVNYGGGGYWYLNHSRWNGVRGGASVLSLLIASYTTRFAPCNAADGRGSCVPMVCLLMRCIANRSFIGVLSCSVVCRFMWLMGTSMALSMSSQRRQLASKATLSVKVVTRSIKLFLLGLLVNNCRDLGAFHCRAFAYALHHPV
jgi:hypothetical protein